MDVPARLLFTISLLRIAVPASAQTRPLFNPAHAEFATGVLTILSAQAPRRAGLRLTWRF